MGELLTRWYSVNSCEATCTVSSWLFTCEYQCGHVTDTCSETTTSQSLGQTTSLGAAATTGGATAPDTTTAGAVTTTSTTTTTTTTCGLEDGAMCTDLTGAECCSGVCLASVDGDNRCGGCLAIGDACTAVGDCCSNVCDTTLGMCTVWICMILLTSIFHWCVLSLLEYRCPTLVKKWKSLLWVNIGPEHHCLPCDLSRSGQCSTGSLSQLAPAWHLGDFLWVKPALSE